MLRTLSLALSLLLLLLAGALVAEEMASDDPHMWLEDVLGEKSLAWVEEQNVRSTQRLEADPSYQPIYDRTLEILDSEDRIPMPSLTADTVYNFWQDKEHPRGILRRTSSASYATESPEWETVIDLDALSAKDGETWVYKGKTCLAPEFRYCMISLSRGGSDATEDREFDMKSKTFVEGGFFVPEAKNAIAWKDANALWVGTDFGEGSQTQSGYARIIKSWERGQKLEDARQIFETRPEDNGVWPGTLNTADGDYTVLYRYRTFFDMDLFLSVGDRLVKLPLPKGFSFQGIFRDHVLFSLRADWQVGETTHAKGSLLAVSVNDLLQGASSAKALFTPSDRVALDSVATTRDQVLITTLDNVKSRLYSMTLAEGGWKQSEVELPGLGTVTIRTASEESDEYFFVYEDFLTPDTLYYVAGSETPKAVKALPSFYDAKGLAVSQFEATSKDGTQIPYFLVAAEGLEKNGKAPTLLYGYGGFEISMTSGYSATAGASWLERGGVYVLANIRGGGEFGPAWHQAAVQENHMRNFEDFIAVAEDLIERKITSPDHLGIMGGSQGGLLVNGTYTLRPDLFGAVVSQVPLADMKRYHLLLAGASWVSEYGNPDDPEDWASMKEWSPYQLLKKDAEYPEVFFWTTTRDDRVHPAHARKMVARMMELGHPVLYFENTEGGHGSGSVNTQRAQTSALQYAYLWSKLK